MGRAVDPGQLRRVGGGLEERTVAEHPRPAVQIVSVEMTAPAAPPRTDCRPCNPGGVVRVAAGPAPVAAARPRPSRTGSRADGVPVWPTKRCPGRAVVHDQGSEDALLEEPQQRGARELLGD